MNPAENVPAREPVYFSRLVKEFKKKGYSYIELVEKEACTLIVKPDKKQSIVTTHPIAAIRS
ncbi:MAG: hypothetical protein M3342_18170 [Bacteroidota bacterium]|nr:hypothetical protein [Flavisolibacter sp.]MBD0350108.1 hypothetical protein [Flavisolibacter sp.]MBD0375046.1 hypothetical protein [Flavisolibacter sp.]MDQ3845914.1 hypothetical protein [Bacteroidota bacterium]